MEDKRTLVRFVGWGGLSQAFDPANADWSNEYRELRELLPTDEYLQARRSTQDAHYTSQEVIEGIYEGLGRMGFQGPAKVLEPSAGIGNFLGLMPDSMREKSDFVAVELDPVSAAIGGYLYPKANYHNFAFQTANPADAHFDLVVGNPPFGNQKIYDAARPDLDFSIHNYFLARSMDSIREGGLAAFVVSRYFLDAQNNPAREYLAERANLVGAIRLPNTAFRQNALTDVTTDIVFFQRTNTPEQNPAWLKTGQIQDADGNEITINQYFIDHPRQMAGHMAMSHNMFQSAADLLPDADFTSFQAEISSRLAILPQGLYRPRTDLILEAPAKDDPNRELCAHLQTEAFFVTHDGGLARRKGDVLGVPQYELYEPKNKRAAERIKGLVPIRDCQRRLMDAEQSPDVNQADLDVIRGQLNTLYDKFIQKHGLINSLGNRQAMRDDPAFPLVSALELDYDPGLSKEAAAKEGLSPVAPSARKAAMFYKRVLGQRREISRVETAKEALVVSMNELGKPDLDFMEGLYGKPAEEISGELRGLIYLNPTTTAWEIADHYLTGNVKTKFQEAQAAAKNDHRFQENLEALLAVQPPDLEPVDISVQLGSTWVPPEVVGDFCQRLFGYSSDEYPGLQRAVKEIGYHPALGEWVLEYDGQWVDRTRAADTFGTSRYAGPTMVRDILNNRPIKVEDEVGRDPETNRPIMQLNEAETAAANAKADAIRQEFKDWVWQDQARRESLSRIYNDTFNTHVPRKYDGSHLELPGSALDLQLRPHQKDAIWRGIQDGTALFDHVVGAGKTLCVVGTIMESRRMGLMKKPMVVVPNHLLNQWKDAFYSLYPQANILVADKNDFKKENREKLFAKAATGDWDAIVVAHSSFKRIGLPKEALNRVMNEEIDDLTRAIGEMREEGDSSIRDTSLTVKQMEKKREQLKARMERRADTGAKDKAVTFADLGVDALFVDEAHEFKNLFINTKMRNVAGLGNVAGSDKAFDMYVKCRYLQEKNNGRGVYFATGTPISNTIAEMYTMQRFLQHDMLKEKGLGNFDSWASAFGEVSTGWELDATGVGYKLNSRFAKFQNMPELVNMYRTVGDVVSRADIVEQNKGQRLTPKMKGGKPRNVIAERSELQAKYMGIQQPKIGGDGLPVFDGEGNAVLEYTPGSIVHRMEHLPKDPREDNPLKITNDARKAGLDFRLVNPNAPDFEGSKINLAADEITRIWKEWEADKGAQLVFCDLSTPKGGAAAPMALADGEARGADEEPSLSMDELLSVNSNFSVYDDLKMKLMEKGIPNHEIKFIHDANSDAQKAKLFDDVNQGRVRVLIGSTAKMGAGMNVQKRLVAEHQLDAPWRPSDIAQREGRIDRQGNMLFERDPENFEIEVLRYATEKTYDARMWQTIEVKAASIEQFRKGDSLARVIDDVAGEAANAAEMKAAATGNELIFTQVKLQSELKKMEGVYQSFQRGQHQLETRIARLESAPAENARIISQMSREIELRDKNTSKEPFFFVNGRIYDKKQHENLLHAFKASIVKAVRSGEGQPMGNYRGFDVTAHSSNNGQEFRFSLKGAAGRYEPDNLRYGHGDDFNVRGFISRLDNFMGRFEKQIEGTKEKAAHQARELATAKASLGRPFPQLKLLLALRDDNRQVMAELRMAQKNPAYKSPWEPQSWKLTEGQEKKQDVQERKGPEKDTPKQKGLNFSR